MFVVAVFFKALKENFEEAEVEVVDCPDLTEEPFTLAAPGMIIYDDCQIFFPLRKSNVLEF